ncbi:MMPL family transporter [Treponema sp.]|uniref:MMPL family transporter n=1 Tax=Treponema sp. TaxID=166 RepID=UPI00388D8994
MKKLASITDRFSNRHFFALWLVTHFIVLAIFGLSLLFSKGSLKIDADLFNMLPKQFSGESVEKADRKLSEVTSRNVFILSCNKDFDAAKDTAEKVYEELKGSRNFKSLSLYQDTETLGQFENFLLENRFNFIDEDAGDASAISEKAMEKLYSPFTYSSLGYLDRDPFLLTEMEMENYLGSLASNGTALGLKDNVLAKEYNGSWYVMVRGLLSKEGSALASRKNGISEIYDVCSKYEKDGQRFVYSGTTFHSHKSSNAASKEITIISVVSLTAVLAMLLLVFRTPVPILLSLGSIGVSVLTAFLLTISVFHRVHVLTLIFGTSLIGSCIDYSLHYFINWKANTSLTTGAEIRKYLFSGLLLSLISTEICFAILIFAPFELLKQMSVFSLSGIFSSFLSVVCIYPLVPVPENKKRRVRGTRFVRIPKWYNRKIAGRCAVTAMFVFAFTCLGVGYKHCRIENDLSRLYKMEGRVLEDQIESARVLNYAPRGWFIIRGSSADELIVLEKKVVSDLRNNIEGISLFCTSDFLPSREQQDRSKKIYESLLPVMEAQLSYIGEDESMAQEIRAEWESKKNVYTTMEDFPEFIQTACANSWLGEIEGTWYSVVMPSFIPEGLDGKTFAAKYGQDVFYINKMADISHDMDILTVMILKFFAVAYVLIFVVLKMFYKLKQSLKIISIPLLIILLVSSVFAIAKIHLEFFSITGIILVFGLGLDYVIYMVEAQKRNDSTENKRLEPYAILLSFFTTAISFGAISLSSFTPVHLMGLAILVGLITAYYSSFFYER